jgi:glycosyltransferase involved in cell wall biosynthesis
VTKSSIIIPAFNEEASIGALLTVLSTPEIDSVCEIFVICNGCSDTTFAIASSFENVSTSESLPGKSRALNQGDRLANDLFPRLYLDADVRISSDSVLSLLQSLDTSKARVAGPRVEYDLDHRPFVVQRFYRAQETVPCFRQWRSEHLEGRGVYGTNHAARRRFGEFPEIRADDAFFDRQYVSAEKITVDSSLAKISTPTSVGQLIRNEMRAAVGNRELALLSPESVPKSVSTKPKWISSWRHPQISNLVVWLLVEVWVRIRIILRLGSKRRESWR